MKRIQTLQNQLLKVLAGKEYRFSTDKLHAELELLKIKDIKDQEILAFVHNFFSNKLPAVFDGYFKTLASIHNRNTRHGNDLIKITGHDTDIEGLSIKIQGAKLWNKMNSDLKKIPKVKKFKKEYKLNCLQTYNNQINS